MHEDLQHFVGLLPNLKSKKGRKGRLEMGKTSLGVSAICKLTLRRVSGECEIVLLVAIKMKAEQRQPDSRETADEMAINGLALAPFLNPFPTPSSTASQPHLFHSHG